MKQLYFLSTILIYTMNINVMNAQEAPFCDPNTGLCTPSPLEGSAEEIEYREDVGIIYVGDPMCSWCWGISPALHQLRASALEHNIPYNIVVGGLRPGGGDEWNENFRDFLKHHWEEVHARSGQPFGYDLFQRDTFNYDTEPSCRAVVAARKMKPEVEARFFEMVQHYFYVKNEDPKELSFYQPICEELGLDFQQFSELFESEAIKKATMAEFQLNRQWGIRGYPTVLIRKGEQLYAIARGFSTYEQMWQSVEEIALKTK
jgi:putative protein-disulfide isomerase